MAGGERGLHEARAPQRQPAPQSQDARGAGVHERAADSQPGQAVSHGAPCPRRRCTSATCLRGRPALRRLYDLVDLWGRSDGQVMVATPLVAEGSNIARVQPVGALQIVLQGPFQSSGSVSLWHIIMHPCVLVCASPLACWAQALLHGAALGWCTACM